MEKLIEREEPSHKDTSMEAWGVLTGMLCWEGLRLNVWCKVCANHTFKESNDIEA